MTDNPYMSPNVSASIEQRDRRPVVRLSHFEIWIGRIACGCLFVLAMMYMCPLILAPHLAIQPGLMLGIPPGPTMIAFKVAYTVCLLASFIGYLFDRVTLAFLAMAVIAMVTILGLVMSVMNWATLAPFGSVADKFFEIATAVVSVLTLAVLSRRLFCFRIPANSEANAAANSAG